MSSSACDDHHDSGPYCHCEEGHGPDVAIRSPRPPCLPLWGRCPVRTLGGEGLQFILYCIKVTFCLDSLDFFLISR